MRVIRVIHVEIRVQLYAVIIINGKLLFYLSSN